MSLDYLNLNKHSHCPERDVFFGYEDPSVCCPQVVCGRSRPSDVVITAGQEVDSEKGFLLNNDNDSNCTIGSSDKPTTEVSDFLLLLLRVLATT